MWKFALARRKCLKDGHSGGHADLMAKNTPNLFDRSSKGTRSGFREVRGSTWPFLAPEGCLRLPNAAAYCCFPSFQPSYTTRASSLLPDDKVCYRSRCLES